MEVLPKISIITIVYNDVKNIEKTIKNVLFEQEYSNKEYIIIDGGSTDGTLEIVNKYRDKISAVISEKDQGISDAFNKGTKQASGDLVGLINSGDYYEPNILSEIAHLFLKSDPNIPFRVIHGKLTLFNSQTSKTYLPKGLDTFTFQMPIWHPTCFVSREVYIKMQYDLDYKIAMDYDLFSRIYADKGAFYFLDKTVAHMNTEGISNVNATKGFDEVCKASMKNLKVSSWKAYLYREYRKVLFHVVNLKKRIC
ncbi:MAG: glycosyltransferase [Sphingobacterium sp.]|jgi:glycosyltransferase involved in cell wall biosynthesis|uniref:glycosyltransferase family 2 protein n=1 Tax=unclassified Sphingobacterium TaxID=2609468 RepID=UPI00284BBB0D|nr:glycosyltransferase family 2 protein [Sphingobacterium sp.]MDR3011440.1 glycosyltransferase [Sphingobacterium sp.]